jgi:hypothetical protein
MTGFSVRQILHGLLPRRIKPRRVPFGPCAGAVVNVDFRLDLAFYLGRHEPDLHAHYRRLLRPGMRSFDVGTYRGWDALLLARLTGGEVVSFDCVRGNLANAAEFLRPSGISVRFAEGYVSDGWNGGPTLDMAAEDDFIPDFIKIDVEGAEWGVLRGARRILMARRPSLVVETHGVDVENSCVSLLRGFGYQPVVVERSRGFFSEARGLDFNRWLVCEGRP